MDIAKDVETRFDTSTYGLDRTIPKGKNKTIIGLIKNEWGRMITTDFAAVKPKTYSYLTHYSYENEKSKRHKKVCCKTKN